MKINRIDNEILFYFNSVENTEIDLVRALNISDIIKILKENIQNIASFKEWNCFMIDDKLNIKHPIRNMSLDDKWVYFWNYVLLLTSPETDLHKFKTK